MSAVRSMMVVVAVAAIAAIALLAMRYGAGHHTAGIVAPSHLTQQSGRTTVKQDPMAGFILRQSSGAGLARELKADRLDTGRSGKKLIARVDRKTLAKGDLEKLIRSFARRQVGKTPGRARQAGTSKKLASLPAEALPSIPNRGDGRLSWSLRSFYHALNSVQSGVRLRPVTILHLGDSHIASDSFSRGVRRQLQTRFGDAGRGLVAPPGTYPYHRAHGWSFRRTGTWRSASSLKQAGGPYGIAGVRTTASSPGSSMIMASSNGRFDWAEVRLLKSPRGGKVTVRSGGKTRTIDTAGRRNGLTVARIDGRSSAIEVVPAGGGPVTVLGLATGKNRPGVRYISLGIPGATADVMTRWTPQLVEADVASLNPDLIIFGYGTNEGFNDNVDLRAYSKRATAMIKRLKRAAPQASWLFIGPADAARRTRATGRTCAGGPWRIPPKLPAIRGQLKSLARQFDAGFWNWSAAMGGTCSVLRWARSNPGLAAKDHVHLTQRGYDVSAKALYRDLMAGFTEFNKLASRQ